LAADIGTAPIRKPRADAERNRRKLLDAARAAFTTQRTLATTEEIARTAGVGIGTLYRHFPTRDDLVVEVYRNEMSRLLEAARQLANSKPPLEALRSWLLLFVDHLADNIVLGDVVKAVAGPNSKEAATEPLSLSLSLLVEQPVARGDIADPGIDPRDLLRALYGVATASPAADWQRTAKRMVEILIAGMAHG
jgi:AcrR family transcriptional regulator